MLRWLWMIPALPFTGFLLLALVGARLSRRVIAFIGCRCSGFVGRRGRADSHLIFKRSTRGNSYTQTIWVWLDVAGFHPGVAFYIDALSLVMILVITFVAFLIHLYSTEFMIEEEEGYSRFFAYMNLFVGSMLTLVLADNFCCSTWGGRE